MAIVRRLDGKGILVDTDGEPLDSSLFDDEPILMPIPKQRVKPFPPPEDLYGESGVTSDQRPASESWTLRIISMVSGEIRFELVRHPSHSRNTDPDE